MIRTKVTGGGLLVCLALALSSGCGRDAASHLATGIERLREGNFEAAATVLELAAEAQPANPSVYCNLGLAYWKLGQTPRAIEALQKADRLSQGDERPLEFLGQIYIAEGNLDGARETFEQAAQRAPLSARILTSRAVVEAYDGEPERARALLEHALELDAAYAPAIYNMGVLYRGPLSDRGRATMYFRKYVRVGPDGERKTEVREWLGPRLHAAGAPSGSPRAPERPRSAPVPATRETDRVEPESTPVPAERARGVIAKARQAIANDELDMALVLLNRCVQQIPESADALWLLAVLYNEHLEYPEQAQATYALFRQRFPADPRVDAIPAPPSAVSDPEEPSESASAPEAAAVETEAPAGPARDPDAARRALRKGVRFYRTREWDAAIAAYKQALSLDPEMTDAYYNLGLAYQSSGKPAKARRTLRRAVEISPDMLSARYMLAVVCREVDDLDAALVQLEVVLENDPHYAKAHLLAGLVYRDLERYDEARRHFQRYINMEPDSRFVGELKEWMESGPGSS